MTLEPLSFPQNLAGHREREQLKGTRITGLVPISLQCLIDKDRVHNGGSADENREPGEGVSQAPDSAFP